MWHPVPRHLVTVTRGVVPGDNAHARARDVLFPVTCFSLALEFTAGHSPSLQHGSSGVRALLSSHGEGGIISSGVWDSIDLSANTNPGREAVAPPSSFRGLTPTAIRPPMHQGMHPPARGYLLP